MTHRTASGRALAKRKKAPKRARVTEGEKDPDLGAITWSFALLLMSVVLAAASVFTHHS